MPKIIEKNKIFRVLPSLKAEKILSGTKLNKKEINIEVSSGLGVSLLRETSKSSSDELTITPKAVKVDSSKFPPGLVTTAMVIPMTLEANSPREKTSRMRLIYFSVS
jgi:hypothetical protein